MKSATNFKNHWFRRRLICIKRSGAAREFSCTRCILLLTGEVARVKNVFLLTQHYLRKLNQWNSWRHKIKSNLFPCIWEQDHSFTYFGSVPQGHLWFLLSSRKLQLEHELNPNWMRSHWKAAWPRRWTLCELWKLSLAVWAQFSMKSVSTAQKA